MKRIGIGLIVLIVVAAAGFFFRSGGPPAEPPAPTVVVSRGDVVVRVIETGSLEPAAEVEIKSEQSGEVKRLFVSEGAAVAAGDPLAVIQQESGQARQAAQFRASLEEEALNQEAAEREVVRQRELLGKGFASKKELEDAERKRDQARLRHALAQRQLQLILGGNESTLEEYLKRDLAAPGLDLFTIQSPADGTVINVSVSEGEIIASGTSNVGGGTALMRIADLSKMLVRCRINEVNVIQVKVGQPVELTLDAVPGRTYHGKVAKIASQGERVENVVTYLVTVEVEDTDAHLRPTMTANVDIIADTYRDVLFVPLEALESTEGRTRVYIQEDGVRQARDVEIVTRTDSVAVVREGLREGDRVYLPRKTNQKAS